MNLALGIRRYSSDESETKVAFGINGKTQLADNVTGYASYLRTSLEDEWKIGANYRMSEKTYLDLNYTYHNGDGDYDGLEFKGFGLGIGFIF